MSPHPPRRRRRLTHTLTAGLCLTAVASGLSGLGATTAAADPGKSGPHRSASKARAFGSGSMGWRNEERRTASGAQAQQQQADNYRKSAPASSRTSASSKKASSKKVSGVLGIDVSSWQKTVNWSSYKSAGKQFAYVKATEGSSYRNPYFSSQYTGSYKAGMIRGAYHFALPNGKSAVTQANYFADHGGGWSKDGKTLPGVLDIEYNPYGSTCYGLSKTAMVSWVKSFTTQYKKRTKRDAVIYTTADWWSQCTGNSTAFNKTNPLWVARYSSSVGTLPGKWPFYTFWQYSASPIDQNKFSSTSTQLKKLATG